ncbi:MAG: hypothetical protein IJP93_06395 [Bacteroidales bacterium]|nr:hypothetical protein [Bacteroidales bacterium]MBR0083697.1 hypothetical protein [Bacteroidales bacterium]
MRPDRNEPEFKEPGLFFAPENVYLAVVMAKAGIKNAYSSPETEILSWEASCIFASSYNPDDHTEYIVYEDGGLL